MKYREHFDHLGERFGQQHIKETYFDVLLDWVFITIVLCIALSLIFWSM